MTRPFACLLHRFTLGVSLRFVSSSFPAGSAVIRRQRCHRFEEAPTLNYLELIR